MRRRVPQLAAILVLLAGAVFALQGFAFLPSRIMYGKPAWIVIGTLMVLGSAVALWRMRA